MQGGIPISILETQASTKIGFLVLDHYRLRLDSDEHEGQVNNGKNYPEGQRICKFGLAKC